MEKFVNKLIKRLQSEVNYNDGAETGAKQAIEVVSQECAFLDERDTKIRNNVIDEVISKILPYGSLCVEWNGGMSKEQIAESVLNQAKEQFIDILEQLRN